MLLSDRGGKSCNEKKRGGRWPTWLKDQSAANIHISTIARWHHTLSGAYQGTNDECSCFADSIKGSELDAHSVDPAVFVDEFSDE